MRTAITKGDYGFKWQFRFLDQNGAVTDISAGSTRTVVLTSPSGVRKSKTAAFTTDGTDGYVEYEAVSGDIDEAGWWLIQFIVSGSPIFEKSHEPVGFPVAERL